MRSSDSSSCDLECSPLQTFVANHSFIYTFFSIFGVLHYLANGAERRKSKSGIGKIQSFIDESYPLIERNQSSIRNLKVLEASPVPISVLASVVSEKGFYQGDLQKIASKMNMQQLMDLKEKLGKEDF